MKKRIIFLTALILSASLFSGCEGRPLSPSDEQLTSDLPQVPTMTITEVDPFRSLSFTYYHNKNGEITEKNQSLGMLFLKPETVTIDGKERNIQVLTYKYAKERLRKCEELGCRMSIYRDVPEKDLKEGDTVTLHLRLDNEDIPEESIPEYVEKVYGIRLKQATKDIKVHFEDEAPEIIDPFEGVNIYFVKENDSIVYEDNFSTCRGNLRALDKDIFLHYIVDLEEGKDIDKLFVGDKLRVTVALYDDNGKEIKGPEVNDYLEDNWRPARFTETEKIIDVYPGYSNGRYSANVNVMFQKADNWHEIVKDKKKFDKYDLSHIDGSTATIPITAELVRQYCAPEDDKVIYYVDHNTTGPAYEKLIKGEDEKNIILVTEPSDDELEMARKNDVELDVTPIALDGFVFITHKNNPVDSLTVEQIQGIYSGAITNWKEVGGNDEAITAYQREANSGSQTAMENLVMKGIPLMEAPKSKIQITMGGLVDAIAEYKNSSSSIGYTFYYYLNNLYKNEDIKVLKVNGISPENKNLLDKSYPFYSGYYAVTLKGGDKKAEEIKNYLISDEGQELIKLAGYCPVK